MTHGSEEASTHWNYAVTFENPSSSAPATVRGEVEAHSPTRALPRAFNDAKRKLPGKRFDSLVVVLERSDR